MYTYSLTNITQKCDILVLAGWYLHFYRASKPTQIRRKFVLKYLCNLFPVASFTEILASIYITYIIFTSTARSAEDAKKKS